MALTVRKKSGLIIPKTPKLILPGMQEKEESITQKIIEQEIKRIIKEQIGIKSRSTCKRIDFFPVYKTRKGEKEICKFYIKNRYTLREAILNVEIDIESKGVTLLEFLDYIIRAGAQEIHDPNRALEIM